MATFGLETHPTAQKLANTILEHNTAKEKFASTDSHYKIIAGTYFLHLLENNEVQGLRSHTVRNLNSFLTRYNDVELFRLLLELLSKETGTPITPSTLTPPDKKKKKAVSNAPDETQTVSGTNNPFS